MRNPLKLNLRTKVIIIFTFTLLILILNALFFSSSIQTITNLSQTIRQIDGLTPSIQAVNLNKLTFIESRERAESEAVLEGLNGLRREIQLLYKSKWHTETSIQNLEKLYGILDQYEATFQEFVVMEEQKLALEDDWKSTTVKFFDQLADLRNQLDQGEIQVTKMQDIKQLMNQMSEIVIQESLSETLKGIDVKTLNTAKETSLKVKGAELLKLFTENGNAVIGYKFIKLSESYDETLSQYRIFQSSQNQRLLILNQSTISLLETSDKLVETLQGQMNQLIKTLMNRLLLTVITSIILAGLLTWFFSADLLKRLKSVVSATELIAEGVYHLPLELSSNEDELDHLSNSVNHMALKLQAAQAELVDNNKDLEEKIVARTSQLSKTLEDLKRIQFQIIQSEKMAAVGQLISGIAHEINTPLGAINSSIGNTKHAIEQLLQLYPVTYCNWSDQEKRAMKRTLELMEKKTQHLTTREERQLKKQLTTLMADFELDSQSDIKESLINLLSDLRIYNPKEVIFLLKEPRVLEILDLAKKNNQVTRSLQTIKISSERASKVVTALKNFAHYSPDGKMELADLVDGIELILTLFHSKIKQGVELIRDYQPLPLVLCNPDELNQVWTNILSNAFQAIAYQGRVVIRTRVEGELIKIEFEDDGSGIPAESQDHIFEPFYTTKVTGEGTGLGLDISKKIIQKHHGQITFTSQPGKTIFTIELPVNIKEAHNA